MVDTTTSQPASPAPTRPMKGCWTLIAAFGIPVLSQLAPAVAPGLQLWLNDHSGLVLATACLVFGLLRLITDSPVGSAFRTQVKGEITKLGLSDADFAQLGQAAVTALAPLLPPPGVSDTSAVLSEFNRVQDAIAHSHASLQASIAAIPAVVASPPLPAEGG